MAILPPSSYFSAQTPMQARAMGTQIGAMEQEQAMREAQLGGQMQAYGAENLQDLYFRQTQEQMKAAEDQRRMSNYQNIASIMDHANTMFKQGVVEHQTFINEAWEDYPEMQKMFPEGAPILRGEGNRIVTEPWVAGEKYPGRVLEADKTWTDKGVVPGKTYVTVTEGENTWFERVPGTMEGLAKVRGKVQTPEAKMKRISDIERAKVKIEQTGAIDPFMLPFLKDSGIDLSKFDPEKAIEVLDRERKILEGQLPESYRIQVKEEKVVPSLDELLKEIQ